MKFSAAVIAVAPLLVSVANAQSTYKREIPSSLAKLAKITEEEAAAAAQARVPKGTIQSVELEREKGKIIYSYDIKTTGASGVDEVHVDAMTGKVIAFAHESPAMEQKEARQDPKAASKKPARRP
jgi:uncharacterized membrane protein YkoI